jgi:hypothetical protein
VPPPVGVRSLDPRAADAPADLVDRVGAPQVEDEEALRVRLGAPRLPPEVISRWAFVPGSPRKTPS